MNSASRKVDEWVRGDYRVKILKLVQREVLAPNPAQTGTHPDKVGLSIALNAKKSLSRVGAGP
jgi:hypothetical protein